MRSLLLGASLLSALVLVATTAPGCGSDDGGDATADGGGTTGDGGCVGFGCSNDGGKPGCVGLECQQAACEGATKTTLTGTVYDPAGKVPIYNATVYVPNDALADIAEGASCDRCDAKVSGKPVVITSTDTSGNFTLTDVPAGANIPVVVQIGKWRRKVTISTVTACTSAIVDPALTRLPKNRTEGNIPRIAVTTGGADPLQCLLRKIGIDDSEFGPAGSEARIHLYGGGGYVDSNPAPNTPHQPSRKLASGTPFTDAKDLWNDAANLKKYDVVLLSCEGGENETDAANPTATNAQKPEAAKQAMYDYAKAGGRVFASHYHYVWFSKSPDAAVKGVASWAVPERAPPATPSDPKTTAVNATISGAFPKAVAMNDWLTKQNALVSGKLPIFDARHDIDSTTATGLTWITAPKSSLVAAGVPDPVQYMTFNTPVGAAEDAVCGRVVVSDIHVAAGQQGGVTDDPSADFPTGCKTTDLSAQQKALEFMLFDLSSCVQKDDAAVTPPR